MPTTLDLEIALAPPPAGAPADTLAAFSVGYEDLRADGLLPALLTRAEREDLRWYLEEYWRWPYEAFHERAMAVEAGFAAVGRRLFAAVLGQARDVYYSWLHDPQADVRRQISLVVTAATPPAALSLPWELLHDDQGFLAMRGRSPVSIVRRITKKSRGGYSQPFTPPLRVLLVTSRPEESGFIDPRGIARPLFDALAPQVAAGQVAIELLRPPSLPALRRRLAAEPPVHLLHFDGHGSFAERGAAGGQTFAGSGSLLFEDDDAQPVAVDAHRILAGIADLEGNAAEAAAHRRQARALFAQFPGNRWHIDRQRGALISAIAAAARGAAGQRAAIEERLPDLEAKGWRIAGATRRIWAGERDWQAICEAEGLDAPDSLIVLRALEELGDTVTR